MPILACTLHVYTSSQESLGRCGRRLPRYGLLTKGMSNAYVLDKVPSSVLLGYS